jgi:hypothetical protein
MTMWYEIPTFPGYRMALDDTVLSLKRSEPHVMKPLINEDGNPYLLLRREGKYVKRTLAKLHVLTFGGELPLTGAGVGLAERTQCNYGHDFTPDNITWQKKANGKVYRRCKTCIRDGVRRLRANGYKG